MASSRGNAAMEAFWHDDFVPLEEAGKSVLAALREDESAPDADLYRRIVSSGAGSHLYFLNEGSPCATLAHNRTVPLPPYLSQQLQNTRVSSLMGLFPEAELVWMSVDEKLFLWSSAASSVPGGMEDFCSYTVPSGQCVVSVGLVRPKKGVFKEVVEWCLVVATPEEVILCAIARSESDDGFVHAQGTLRLIPTRYVLPTDSVPILSVCGTPDGRIFLGAHDGCLYEMSYDSLTTPQRVGLEQRMDAFYDGAKPIFQNGDSSVAGTLATYGKRALSSILPSTVDPSNRPRKCRRLNHSMHASSLASAVVPSFLRTVIGGDTSGGPIVKVILDSERSCLYALTARGWISAFDLGGTDVTLMAVIDAEKTARSYLEAVSRGRMYPPTSHTRSIGNITFPGGGSSAQAGVGGMEGARTILKLADSGAAANRQRRRQQHNAGILTPVSIHVISRRESGRLTLMAITEGGLRYYLSTLSTNVLNSGPGHHSGTNRSTDPLAPSKKFTLCHIRSPPPVDESGTVQGSMSFVDGDAGVEGYTPRAGGRSNRVPHVDTGYYEDGIMMLALEHNIAPASSTTNGGASNPFDGDVVIATAPDSVARKKNVPATNSSTTQSTQQHQQQQQQEPTFTAPGGISETISLPLTAPMSSTMDVSPVLKGGRILDIASTSTVSSVLKLTLNSQTPSDSELKVGLVPAYFPPSRLRSQQSGQRGRETSHSPMDAATGDSRSLVAANQGGNGSVALTIMKNILLSRPIRQGLMIQRPQSQLEAPVGGEPPIAGPLYRISNRYGDAGFSSTAGEQNPRDKNRSGTKSESRSARLSPWLLRPAVAPLNPFAIQHLVPTKGMVALNSGGLHFFSYKSVLSILEDTLMSASVNVGNDEAVTKFFTSYGYAQGCAMCLSLAVGCGPASQNGELRSRAKRAALSRAYIPKLVMKDEHLADGTGATVVSASDDTSGIPPGYEFKPSSLAEGLTALVSRLLRPVWCKPAVVVTEGQVIKAKSGRPSTFPAKVELLLDELTLEEVQEPLVAVQSLMRETFGPAVLVVPGARNQDPDSMDVEEEVDSLGQNTFTNAMQYRGFVRAHSEPGAANRFTPRDAETMARLIEERNLHSLYRLVSRSVQLLSLLSLLKRAQYMPDLRGVDWGLLHGLTVAQLVQMRECQDRIDRLLSSLVSSSASAPAGNVAPSADSDQVANRFASECYLYFSPGSHYAYLGFRAAGEALACAVSSVRRTALTNQVAENLKRAASYWFSAPLITGRILHGKGNESYQQTAMRAQRFDSPLAKAAAVLFQLEDVTALVDVCLITASNFGGRRRVQDALSLNSASENCSEMLPWERTLYHKRRHVQDESRTSSTTTPSSTSTALVVGADVTPKDALYTCHAVLFHYLTVLLDSPNTDLARKMVDACAASNDEKFLHSFYEHLLRTNHVGALMQISSKDLEKWLSRPELDVALIWEYYRAQGKDAKAGEVMYKHAREVNPNLTIDVRVGLLRKAQSSYKKVAEGGRSHDAWFLSEGDRGELQKVCNDVGETLDVAVLQSRVLRTVVSSPSLESKLSVEEMAKLKSTLIPVSDLYNGYAAPLQLSDLCLLILHSCHHNDQAHIKSLWNNVICEEVLPCATRNSDTYQYLQTLVTGSIVDETTITLLSEGRTATLPLFEDGRWVGPLKERLISLGKEVYGNGADFVFPTTHIASTLEGMRHALQTSKQQADMSISTRGQPWPLQVLLEVGVPFIACFEAYESMSGQEERELMGGVESHRRLLHLYSTVELLSEWVMAAQAGARLDGSGNLALKDLKRAVSSGMLMSRIDSFKASLEGLSGPTDAEDARVVREQLSMIEEAIRRIV